MCSFIYNREQAQKRDIFRNCKPTAILSVEEMTETLKKEDNIIHGETYMVKFS